MQKPMIHRNMLPIHNAAFASEWFGDLYNRSFAQISVGKKKTSKANLIKYFTVSLRYNCYTGDGMMAGKEKLKQCRLRSYLGDPTRYLETVAWIPTKFAVVDKVISLKGDTKCWVVIDVGDTIITSDGLIRDPKKLLPSITDN